MGLLDGLVGSVTDVFNVAVPFLIVLTVVVFIHELGHFLVARWCGVTVRTFSIGFGPELFGFNDKRGTHWRFAAIPLGGYVKFVDDDNVASAPGREMAKSTDAGAFHSKTVGQRAAVVAAGPIANFLLAIAILFFVYSVFGVYRLPAIVDEVIPGSAADRAGLQARDRIVEIDGEKIAQFSDMQRKIASSAGVELQIVIERQGNLLSKRVTPDSKEITDALGRKQVLGQIGVKRTPVAQETAFERLSVFQALPAAVNETFSVGREIVAGLPKIPAAVFKVFTGRQQDVIGGPGAIAEISGHAAKNGVVSLLQWTAIISIMLGVMNLLPIPPLDGGHLLYYAYEAVRGRALGGAQQEFGLKLGLMMVGTLMVAAIASDLIRWAGRLFGTG